MSMQNSDKKYCKTCHGVGRWSFSKQSMLFWRSDMWRGGEKQGKVVATELTQDQTQILKSIKDAAIANERETIREIVDSQKWETVKPWQTLGKYGTVFHYSMYHGCFEDLTLAFIEFVITLFAEQFVEFDLLAVLTMANRDGNTVLHLAAYTESSRLTEGIYRLCPMNIYSTNKKQYTALELIFAKTPQALANIFDDCFTLYTERKRMNKEPRGQSRILCLDFRLLVCCHSNEEERNAETSLLASLVRGQAPNSHLILNHPLVQIFLALKLNRLTWPIKMTALLYLSLYLWYILYVIQVFHISFPYSKFHPDIYAPVNYTARLRMTFWHYLSGRWKTDDEHFYDAINEPFSQNFNASLNFTDEGQPILMWGQPALFRIFAIFTLVLEALQLLVVSKVRVMGRSEWESREPILRNLVIVGAFILIARMTQVLTLLVLGSIFFFLQILRLGLSSTQRSQEWMRRLNKNGSFIGKFAKMLINGLALYLRQTENILYLIFVPYLIHVPGAPLLKEIPEIYYVNAAFSVVLAGILTLLQFGSVFKSDCFSLEYESMDLFVQMLKTVLQNFVNVTLKFSAIIAAFSVAFSILFPEDGLFETLPLALLRVLPMMGGEFNWDALFRKRIEGERAPPPFHIARPLSLACFIIVVAIVMINLLTSLTIGQLENVRIKSLAEYTSIRVNRLYVAEGRINLARKMPFFMWDTNVIPRKNGGILEIPFNSLSQSHRDKVSALLAQTGKKDRLKEAAVKT